MTSQPAVQQHVDFFNVIRERQSVRRYDSSVTISREEMKQMIEEATLAPSSSNLQSWRFLIIDEQAQKDKLMPIANNQQQVAEASATVVLLGDLESIKLADQIYDRSVELGMSPEVKKGYVPRLVETYASVSPDVIRNIALVDGGLVAMQFMLVAKARGYDTVPMGGFSAEKLVKEFDIPSRYVPIMLISVGKGTAPGYPKSRLAVEDVIFWNQMD